MPVLVAAILASTSPPPLFCGTPHGIQRRQGITMPRCVFPSRPSMCVENNPIWHGIAASSRSPPSPAATWSRSTPWTHLVARSRPTRPWPTSLALDFSRVDQVYGPIAVDGAEDGDTLEIELLDSSLPTGAGRRASRASVSLRTTLPTPPSDHAPDRWDCVVPPGCAHSRSTRSAGSWGSPRVDRRPLHDPTRPVRREHGHPPPDGRGEALPAGLPRPAAASRLATATRPGRRRGLRHRHRDADARAGPADGPQGPARDRPRVPDSGPLAIATNTARATRPTGSGPT